MHTHTQDFSAKIIQERKESAREIEREREKLNRGWQEVNVMRR